MENNKFKSIKISLMESLSDEDEKGKTNYIQKSHALITVNDLVTKTIEEHGIESVLEAVYNELLEINEDEVDSVGLWVDYDGDVYENSIKLETLKDMEEYGDEEVSPIYELFKLSSLEVPAED